MFIFNTVDSQKIKVKIIKHRAQISKKRKTYSSQRLIQNVRLTQANVQFKTRGSVQANIQFKTQGSTKLAFQIKREAPSKPASTI